ncbi:urokinase plasminogen activator surface receptor-like [Salminus brasiliensis]|uniref:urokinase plasminogen activator surface receptor-like n=1 Tax=Salminus brasiliensis TaxID=930266 RepID=UPI003B834080
MRLQVTPILICMLFPAVLTLKCYQCIPGLSGQCTDTQKDCPGQCASINTATYFAGIKQERHSKSCAVDAEQCITGSLNLGAVRTTVNSKCCGTDLCNKQKTPALPKKSLNGKQCYTCDDNICARTVSCEGDEDHCISGTANAGGVKMTVKGCASKSYCVSPASTILATGITGGVSCCEGNLCNEAEGVKLSLVIILGPLLSSILFL